MHSLPQNLQEALGLPTGVGNKVNLAESPEGKEVWGTTETQGEEEEEETTTAPTSSPNPFPSPSPTSEDTVTYICEYSEAKMACLSITDQTRRPDTSDVPARQELKPLNFTVMVTSHRLPHSSHSWESEGLPSHILRALDYVSTCAFCLFTVGRLASLDAGLHQLHIRLHVLDTRVVELTQGLRQLRDAARDTRDSVQALKEVQVRAEQEHGRLEGESQQHQEGLGGRRGPREV